MDSDSNQSGSSANNPSSTIWELTKLLLPTLATALIGLFIWNEQTKIQIAVDQNKQAMQMQLDQEAEYYKRRLTAYETACRQIAETKTALDQAWITRKDETQAHAMMTELYKLRQANTLYWSPALEKQLEKLWESAIIKLRFKKFVDNQLEDTLTSEIAQLHTQMRQDLKLKK
jgi:L-lactate utilization protein LutC